MDGATQLVTMASSIFVLCVPSASARSRWLPVGKWRKLTCQTRHKSLKRWCERVFIHTSEGKTVKQPKPHVCAFEMMGAALWWNRLRCPAPRWRAGMWQAASSYGVEPESLSSGLPQSPGSDPFSPTLPHPHSLCLGLRPTTHTPVLSPEPHLDH